MTTQKDIINNMKKLGFRIVSRKEYMNSEDKKTAICVNLFQLKPSCKSFDLYFKEKK